MTGQPYRKVALIASAALRDDDDSVRYHLNTCPPDQVRAVCEAAVLALAELVHQFVPAHAIHAALADAQDMARNEALTERN